MKKVLQLLLCLLFPLGAAAAGDEYILSYLSQADGKPAKDIRGHSVPTPMWPGCYQN